ncbi:2-amino-4-hydroxy-6-hydroxymethyldihydropteridinediphosphokinase [Propionibacterium cyclohexanicum]|uniref:2-amino-4-hydroxy-6-hydroxymethyldihydropteridine diphosphokinase n=1 Tax=Propionibacterium cyclohexanicum TaxID=64702 RepID=A0A1H9RUI1_9ACTN|nr:2-amino-4-hydroxy-6-hydroxymethyldihydropteridine diphosphokinase [Propionibacterium cyclohexanicum]SER76462.1 2-amino-4-hydroxy-6-hydroxymethyldihydropteridinediphosphokinase [Propionibacterium cyclohexanicum]
MTAFSIDSDTLGDLLPLNQVVLGLGSNMGERVEILQGAVDLLAETPNFIVVDVSPIYLTAPIGDPDQPDFYNLVVLADSTLEPFVLLQRCQAIEQAFDRRRDPARPKGPRTLDIDIVAVGSRSCDTEALVLPHPRAHERAFVLVPWLDVEPNAQLPQGRVADLVKGLDVGGVRRLDTTIVKPGNAL